MRVALRCDRHRHAFLDTETGVIEVQCRKCSRGMEERILHSWDVLRLIDREVLERELYRRDSGSPDSTDDYPGTGVQPMGEASCTCER